MLSAKESDTMSFTLQPSVQERLRADDLIWLTTVRRDGRPHSVPVWFLWEGETIVVFSKPHNQKICNLRHNPLVVLALDDAKRGVVILEGTAQLLERGEADTILPAYDEKYRAGLQSLGLTAALFTRLYSQPIRITPVHALVGG
jgi:PPOX class probable F420-dependent enzyme